MRHDCVPSTKTQENVQLRKALRESELLREISELLASSLNLTHILQVLVKRTTEVCDVQRCAVWLLDQDQKRFLPAAYHFSTSAISSRLLHIADRMWHNSTFLFHGPLIQQLLQEKGLLVVEDLHSRDGMNKLAKKFLVRSFLVVALIRENRPVGVMTLDNPGQCLVFSPDQQQLARAIGQQAAVAIDNARLYEQSQNERQRTERLIEHARLINQVAMAVNSGEDLDKILLIATQHLVHGLSAQSAAITILDEPDYQMLTLSQTIFSSPPILSDREHKFFNLHTLPHCSTGALSGNLIFLPQKQQAYQEQQWFQLLDMQHVLIVPLIVGSQFAEPEQSSHSSTISPLSEHQHCIGFVFVNYQQQNDLPCEGRRIFARDIAAQCAHAIEKARILNATRKAVSLSNERANTLDTVLNAMTEGIIVFDMQGQVMLHNKVSTNFVELTPNIYTHLSSYLKTYPAYTFYGHLIQPEDHPLMRALRGEQIRGERFTSKTEDGTEEAFEVNIAPLFDSHGQQIGIVSARRNITEHVRVEQRIRRALDTMLHAAEAVSGLTDISEMLYRVLAMTLTAINCQRGIVQLYDQAEQKFTLLSSIGFPPGEAERWLDTHRYWLEPEGHRYSDIYAQLLAGHATLINTQRYSPLEEVHVNTFVLAAPLTHNNHLLGVLLLDRSHMPSRRSTTHPVVPSSSFSTLEFSAWDMAVVEGIAQFAGLAIEQTHWQQEAEIARTNEASMRESNALKDEFLAITAHEFRTPLTVILAHSQMMGRLLKKNANFNPELKTRFDESLFFIEEQAHQLTNIVNTFLEVTRLNRGQITLNTEILDLEEIAQEAIANHQTALTKHTICYQANATHRPYLLKGDKARLLQIFGNLLQNAVKYSPLGGPITISLDRVPDSDACQTNMIEVCVEDKGIGVPKEAQPYLFERFYRAQNIAGSQARGVGLGLYVVAEFLRLHHGTIHVESNGVAGEGSRFIFLLPTLV
jgi:signal transduction histidine kinase/PAS domain-containing protein